MTKRKNNIIAVIYMQFQIVVH